MEHALGALCSCDRRAIASIWANSKIGDSYFLTLHPTQPVSDCLRVGAAFHAALTEATGGHVLTVRAGGYFEAEYDSLPDPGDEPGNDTYTTCCAACGCLRRVGGAA